MSRKYNTKVSVGFTLIELLVVIAIIGLLSSIIMVAIYNARSKARDAKRIGDMTQMANAIELFHNTNQGYPNGAGGIPQNLTGTGGFLTKLPTAPLPADGNCDAIVNPLGQSANNYYYIPTGSPSSVNGLQVWSDYSYYFCLGNKNDRFNPGMHYLSPKGIK